MIGSKLAALTRYLLAQELCDSGQLETWIDDARLQLVSRAAGDGLKIAAVEYDAIFEFERLKVTPDLLMVHVAIWLMEFDSERDDQDLSDPDIDTEINESGLVDVEITIRFKEDIELVDDPAGTIIFKGKNYRLADTTIDTADTAGVGTDDQQVTDKPYTIAP